MSRRKQAKPRPIFAYEEDGNAGQDVLVPISQTNGHMSKTLVGEDQDEDADYGEFAPLVMDTDSSQCETSSDNTRSKSPHSITILNSLTGISNLTRPEPIKPTIGTKINSSAVGPMISASPLMSSSTSSISGNSEPPSPVVTPTNPSNYDDNSRSSSTSAAGSAMRRGTKNLDMELTENDENQDYDSDFDDLEEFLSELIKHKILPVSDEDGEKFICPVCHTSLLNLHDLTVHIRSHNTPVSGSQSNSCKICAKVLSSQSSLDRHMLVHSGERPFICKVCNMSFTTNGNMHRHSRIHTKEENLKSLGGQFSQARRGKSAWRQHISNYLSQSNSPVNDRMKKFKTGLSQDILKNLPNHSQQSVFGRPSDILPPLVPGVKRQFSGSDLTSDWQIPFKRQSLGSDSDASSSSPKKFSLPLSIEKTEEAQEAKLEESKEREDKEVLHCPACPKTFLCKYGLESHLESHPDFQSHCSLCNLTFKNPRKLRLHRLIAHTEKDKEVGEAGTSSAEKDDTEIKVGFHDLTFVDFSTEKFPLIAKHYFEANGRTMSSTYLNFMCKICQRAFPCETSLILHTYTHTKDKCTQCPICDCDYADLNDFHAHMVKHLSDKAFEDIRPSAKNEKGEDDVTPERLTQHDFLAMFMLKEDEEKPDQHMKLPTPAPNQAVTADLAEKKEVSKPMKVEKNINNDYFAKLGQAFTPGVDPMFGQLPMFPPGYQPTLDDFHKMLQIATNMNMLPSMGPGLLMQGVPGGMVPAHSSPSKPQSGNIPVTNMSATVPKPAHRSGPSPITPLMSHDSSPLSGPEKEINDIKMKNSGMYACKYCDNTFNSYKTLKSHIRTHLGFSPYQCNLCVYSSADKSSLIRHVRTHSGARPFQCLLCDFAFSTRANCERHVRKKHGILGKDELDRAVYLNKFALDTAKSLDNFHSPDTVCKYCGVDFKFFRALKNHLKSHGSGKLKPFQCQLCEMGFCTKFNCLRHVQKQHSEVNNNQIENYIKVIEHYGNDDTDNESTTSDDGIPLYTDESNSPFHSRSGSNTPQPPAAHSTPKPDGLLGHDSRHVSPSRHISPSRLVSPLSHISPAPSPLVIKQEPVERADTPLDFSMKSNSEPIKSEFNINSCKSEKLSIEAPMDLSVKKAGAPVPIAPKPMHFIQCMYCPMGFSDLGAMERHLRKSHGQPGDSPAISAQLSSMPLLNNDGKVLLPPKSMGSMSNFPINNASMYQSRSIKPYQPKTKSVSATIQNLHDKLKQKKDRVAQASTGVESDLASVTRMIDATDQLNFQAFFNPEQSTDLQASVTPSKSATKSHLPNIMKRPGMQISLEHCNAINRELDSLQREGDVDEAALSQVREMALSVKEEVVNSVPPTGNIVAGRTGSPPMMQLPELQGEISQIHDENSGDGSTSSVPKSEGDKLEKGDNSQPKKKRNSYADSPHKLACPYCPRAFPWVSSLTRHLLTHTGQKPFKCPRCPVTFSTKSNRERHLIRKHGVNMLDPLSRQTMDRPYKCPLCVFSSFSTQSNLLKHYRDRHNGVNLPDNIADIERMSPTAVRAATLEMETRAKENPPKVDDSATMMAEEEEEDLDNSVDSSEKIDDDTSYTEMDAGDEAQMETEAEKKENVETSDMPSLIEKPLTLDESDQGKVAPHEIMTMPELLKIKNEELGNLEKMNESLDRAENPEIMKRNIEKIIAEQKAIIEQKSKMEMKIQAEIRAHIDAQRKSENLLDSVSPTPMDVSQDLPHDLNKPFTGSAERIINPERDNYDVDKITACWKCKEMFPSRKVLVRHLKEHNIDLPFKCYLCDASYELRVNCLNHQADAHDSDWNILKDKNRVNDIEQFSVHMDKVVENNCNKLDAGSVLEIPGTGNDESKMEVISADYMQRKVYCSLCPKRFWSLQDLRRHMRSHTGERPFECDICQKRFTLKHSMMRHRKKHAGAPPRSFDDDEDSNGMDDRASKPRSAPSRNVTILPYPSLNMVSSAQDSVNNTYMFAQGLTGGQLLIGGSNIGSLTPSAGTSSTKTRIEPSTSADVSQTSTPKSNPSIDSMKKEFLDCSADMLHNLLGVDSTAIEKMLDSADSKTAAKYLGITEVS